MFVSRNQEGGKQIDATFRRISDPKKAKKSVMHFFGQKAQKTGKVEKGKREPRTRKEEEAGGGESGIYLSTVTLNFRSFIVCQIRFSMRFFMKIIFGSI